MFCPESGFGLKVHQVANIIVRNCEIFFSFISMSSSPFSHSAFYGTKKVAPLKIRNPSIHPSQIMPTPSGIPFNVSDMPWSYNGNRTPGQLMEFNAVIRPSPLSQSPPFGKFQPTLNPVAMCELRKRKTEPEPMPVPPKQFLTEEAMASHLNNMHLSTEYTSHNINTTTAEDPVTLGSTNSGGLSPCSSFDDDMSLGEPGPGSTAAAAAAAARHVYMSPQELEDRLRKAQRIAVCEEVRKLDNRAEILPKVLLERIEKPCTALVLWQPPATALELASKMSTVQEQKEEERRSNEEMMGEDEPLPDLPEYDDDLDFEVNNNNNIATVSDFNSMDIEM